MRHFQGISSRLAGPRSRAAIAAVSCALVVLCLSHSAPAQTPQSPNNWISPAGGNYNDGANWALGAPGGLPGPYPVFNLGSAGYTIQMTPGEGAVDPTVQTDNPTINLNSQTYVDNYLDVSTQPGQNGSLTFVGPGTFTQDLQDDSYINVGGASSTGQLIINGATITQSGLDMSVNVASGSTLNVENGGFLDQVDPGSAMSLNGNVIANNGVVTCGGHMSLGSATLVNGSSVGTGGTLADSLTVSGKVILDDSGLGSLGNVDFTPSASVTLSDNSIVSTQSTLILPPTTDIVSGLVRGLDGVTFGSSLTMQLNLPTTTYFSNGIASGDGVGNLSGVLNLTLPSGLIPTVGEQFPLFDFVRGVTGSFSEINTPTLPAGEAWDLSDIYTTGTITIVPEPTSIGLMLVGGALLLRRRSRKT